MTTITEREKPVIFIMVLLIGVGQTHFASDLSYFRLPSADSIPVRYRRDDPKSDVRRAGVDLFLVPLLFFALALPFEPLRRWTRRSPAQPKLPPNTQAPSES